jgi:ABC-type cobalamin/Fe3+-siderophores transport system ATPase subunit
MKKCIVVVLGPGASGKSTLTRALCGPAAVEQAHGELKEKFVTSPNGYALPGTLKNGSDSVGVMATRAALVLWLLQQPGVRHVVLDGVRSSRRWDVDWVMGQRALALYVYFDISEEENVRRLLQRRKANGHEEAALPEKTYQNMLNFRRRAKGVFLAAQQAYPAAGFVILEQEDAPATAARKVQKAVVKLCK